MSDQTIDQASGTDGVLLTIAERVYFIPRDDLRSFRVPDDVAATVRAQVEAHVGEVSGFTAPGTPGTLEVGNVMGVKFIPRGSVDFSSIMAHALTKSRVC